MHHRQMMLFFQCQRQVFGICPCCGEFFRLSDCKVFKDERRSSDWLENVQKTERRLDLLEKKIEDGLEQHRELAREKGRKEAGRKVKKVDTVFTPRRMNPDDAKVIFHPVDFVVFNGMKADAGGEKLKSIVLLDAAKKSRSAKILQKSVERAIGRANYQWLTLRVEDDGRIVEE